MCKLKEMHWNIFKNHQLVHQKECSSDVTQGQSMAVNLIWEQSFVC